MFDKLRLSLILPREAFRFDRSADWTVLGGERTKLQVAHFKLSYSRAFIVRVYPLQTHEMLLPATMPSGFWAAYPGADLR